MAGDATVSQEARAGFGRGLAALLLAAGLAASRWLLMSSPRFWHALLPERWFHWDWILFTRLALNVACCALLLVLVPALVTLGCGGSRASAIPRPGLREVFGLGRPQYPSPAWPRWVALLVCLSALLGLAAAALLPDLRRAYPLDRFAWPDLARVAVSETLYVALLLCTELFYRGFALRSVARSWPRAAALIVLPIYVLDHVGAPMPELVGSAAAGLILGQLALVTRSIWPGFAIHVACALAVDLGTFLY